MKEEAFSDFILGIKFLDYFRGVPVRKKNFIILKLYTNQA